MFIDHCTFLGLLQCTTLLAVSTAFSITLFGFLSSLAFNNRIENLTLIPKFRGGPYFRGRGLFSGGPEAVPLLSAGRAGPAVLYSIRLY